MPTLFSTSCLGLLGLALTLALTSCGSDYRPALSAGPVGGVQVSATTVRNDGKWLILRLRLVNGTGAPLTIPGGTSGGGYQGFALAAGPGHQQPARVVDPAGSSVPGLGAPFPVDTGATFEAVVKWRVDYLTGYDTQKPPHITLTGLTGPAGPLPDLVLVPSTDS